MLWLIAARLLQDDRPAMAHWAMYALLSAVAMAGLAARPDGPPWFTGPGVGAASLAGLLVARRGAELFLALRPRDGEHAAVAVLAVAALLWLGPGAVHAHARVGLTAGLSALVLARALHLAWRPVRAEYGRRLTLAAAAPVVAMTLLNLWIAALAVFHPASMADVTVMPGTATWVTVLVSAAAFNFLFLFLLVRRLNQRLRHQARHDPLTDLLNRRAMGLVLDAEWQRWRRLGTPFTLIGLDADHFKQINDQHDHEAGDRVLRALADRLRSSLREVDRVARMGGEEFLVMLPGCDCWRDDAGSAERLRAALSAFPVDCGGGVRLNVTASWGVTGPMTSDSSLDELLRRVDAAVYAAKQGGRDRVVTAGAAAVA